jgi:D-3-phosphoglycerate dehydrogenase
MMKTPILVTAKEYEKGRDVFVEMFDGADALEIQPAEAGESALAERVRQTSARMVIVGVDRYCGELYPALAGGLIARFGVGYDGIDRKLCLEHKIVVTNTPGALTRSVAEHAIWLTGCLARNVAKTDRRMRRNDYRPECGEELFEKNLLIVGFGQIGRDVARIAGGAFGMSIRAFDCAPLTEAAGAEGLDLANFLKKYHLQTYTADIEPALAWADIVSVHMAANEQTRHFFNTSRFGCFRKGAMFINTSRGSVVDERALYHALSDGRLAGAALDVFENEPYRPVSPDCDLRKLENVVLTPHIGSNTSASNRRMASMCLENCRNFLAGKLDRLTRVI